MGREYQKQCMIITVTRFLDCFEALLRAKPQSSQNDQLKNTNGYLFKLIKHSNMYVQYENQAETQIQKTNKVH